MNIILPENIYKFLPLDIKFEVSVVENGGKSRQKNGFDALKEIVVDNKIFYSEAASFNDPFEFDGVMLNSGQDDQKKQVGYNILSRCGIICFSSQVRNTLMWSHYADAHRGVALRFKCVPDPFYSIGTEGRVVKVDYGDEIIFKDESVFNDNYGILEKLGRKARCWSYENEYRVFNVPSHLKADDATGIQNFNSELVDAIYLGIKSDDTVLQKVKGMVEMASHQIDLYQPYKCNKNLFLKFKKI
ncbi:DUF2971 domain-containing protein [Desulfosediminicola flagellatus]|uniref:DUF2971 domain-containing protein n=1 Tax=Desulfosediminicola flagellatus TaxID=2569541 RepID=UPI00142EC1BC|nr:DUF2971 domain-containing protein [Desulfosediminicola flagellatus]